MRPTPASSAAASSASRLVVAVEHDALGREAGVQRDVQLAAGGDVEVRAPPRRRAAPSRGRGTPCPRRPRASAPKCVAVLAAPGAQVVLVVDEQRRAELAGQRRRGRSPPMARRPSSSTGRGSAASRAPVDAARSRLVASSSSLVERAPSRRARARRGGRARRRARCRHASVEPQPRLRERGVVGDAPGSRGRSRGTRAAKSRTHVVTLCGARSAGGLGDDLGILGERAQQVELALVHEQREVDVSSDRQPRDPAPRPPCARSTRCARARTARSRRGSPSTAR